MDQETGTRRFIDGDLADAARVGDVLRFVDNPFAADLAPGNWAVALGRLGVDLATYRLGPTDRSLGTAAAAARRAAEEGHSYLAADLVRVVASLGGSLADGRMAVMTGIWLDHLELDEPQANLTDVQFQDSVIAEFAAPRDGISDDAMPRFLRCHFGTVDGRTSGRDVPSTRFIDCTYDAFGEPGETTAQLLAMSLPLAQRVGLTVLKKLYAQRGRGRKESALSRGLSPQEHGVVPKVLDVLVGHGLAVQGRVGRETIWLPVRGAARRAHSMLEGPTTCADPAWTELAST
ncbi:MAG: hypothetical protein M3355_10935 [Actinomycetota bacterium]|nr:hypothetical protein [Actinomycetota bacterium]